MTGLPHAHRADEPQPRPDSARRDFVAAAFAASALLAIAFLASLDVTNANHRLVIAVACIAGIVAVLALIALHVIGANPYQDDDR